MFYCECDYTSTLLEYCNGLFVFLFIFQHFLKLPIAHHSYLALHERIRAICEEIIFSSEVKV